MQLGPTAIRALGGRRVLRSGALADVRRGIARGLRGTAVAHIERTMGLSPAESTRVLGISPATRKRILGAQLRPLAANVADRALRAARIYDETVEHFGEKAAAGDWLRSRIHALGNERPLDLLDSDIGTQTIHDLLVQMEHGMIS